ncbi:MULTISPECIES: hypothetical protein [Clostridia]|uniref:hypothetical protein n=1 Tax=Clostridia TaxID=186801 RepID=UPI000EA3732A|nr:MULTISPECIES: hypothetical protein [Clostridia]NBJ70651.1 hypothetical protein [Roseburia sp. 1XD42-34]RKI75934.1 hypothetical protein D7V87_14810 [Clostridium sp. 1xD42-85]
MTMPLMIVIVTVIILSTFVIGITMIYRDRIASMTGMMIAMALGMIVGLTIGVIVGILLMGNLFYSTVISMLVGIVVGCLAGIPVSLLAVLDGTLSGLMGSMMGAMLGEMIMQDYQDPFIRVMFMIFLMTMILILWVIRQTSVESKKLWNHPFILLIAFVLVIIGFNEIGPLVAVSSTH